MTIPSATGIVIVGAGAAGLILAAGLRRRGVDARVLESGRLGESWRRRFDGLRLHTSAWESRLGPRTWTLRRDFPTRDAFVAALEGHARREGIDVEEGVEVLGVVERSDGVEVRTASESIRARRVVIATGTLGTPVWPDWSRAASGFPGEVLHSRDVPSIAPLSGRSVLVVGAGNSGADLATALAAAGEAPALAIGHPLRLAAPVRQGLTWRAWEQGVFVPLAAAARRLGVGPARAIQDLWAAFENWPYRDLSARGVPLLGAKGLPAAGRRATTPVTSSLADPVRQGAIRVRPRVLGLEPSGVRFADGSLESFDVVVCATGFRDGMEHIVGDEIAARLRQDPVASDASGVARGVLRVGVRPLLPWIRSDATALARMLARVEHGRGARP